MVNACSGRRPDCSITPSQVNRARTAPKLLMFAMPSASGRRHFLLCHGDDFVEVVHEDFLEAVGV